MCYIRAVCYIYNVSGGKCYRYNVSGSIFAHTMCQLAIYNVSGAIGYMYNVSDGKV